MGKRESTPLTALVQDGVLIIRIGIDTLAFAAEREPMRMGTREREPGHFVSDKAGFAADVVRVLLDEEEDGSSRLTDLFDQACEDAINDGSEYWDIANEVKP